MEKIGLLVDSTTFTREDLRQYPFIKAAPLGVTIDGIHYSEFELTTEAMLEHLHTAKKMTTSQPSPGEFFVLYEEFYKQGYTNILVITLSEKISGTFQAAMIAKTMVEFPLDISIHAPKLASFGVALGIPVLAEMIVAGASFAEVTEHYYSLYANGTVMFTLANLMHLFRGGRLSRVQALLGTVLKIKPVVEMIDGKLELTRKERTNLACFDYFMGVIDKYVGEYRKIYLDIIHLNRIEWAEKLKTAVAEKYPDISIHMTEYVSPVFFVHLGDAGFGIAILAE